MELALGYFPYLKPGQEKPAMPGEKGWAFLIKNDVGDNVLLLMTHLWS